MDVSSSKAAGLVGQMMKKDSDASGKLSQAEYKSYLASKSGNSAISDAAAAASFKQMDADGDGGVSEAEATTFFTPPQVDTSSLLNSTTTASLLDALAAENTQSASSSPDALTQLLASYTSAQKKLGGSFSGDV